MNRLYTLFILFGLLVGSSYGETVKIKRYGEDEGLRSSHVHFIIQDHEGCIWLSSWDGLKRFDGHSFHNYKARPGDGCPLVTNRINHIEELKNGQILCRAMDQCYLFTPQTGKFTPTDIQPNEMTRNVPDSIDAKIRALPEYANIDTKVRFVDRQGGIWVYSSRGLERVSFQPDPIRPQKASPDVEEHIRLLFADSQGCIWIGSKDGYLRKMTPQGQLIGYLMPDGRMSASRQPIGMSAYCMLEDSQGQLWIGTKGDGLMLLKPTPTGYDITRYTTNDGLPDNRIYSLAEDAHHRIWIGTFGGGIALLTRQMEEQYTIQGIENVPAEAKQVHALKVIDGVLVVATTKGLITSEVKSDIRQMDFLLHQRDPERPTSLCNNTVMDVVISPTKVILPTLGGGYSIIKRDQLKEKNPVLDYFSTEWGLASDENQTGVVDKDNALWIVSTQALSRIEPGTKAAAHSGRITVENYTRSFFGDDFTYSEIQPLLLPDGRLLIGTTKGVLCFLPSAIRKSGYVPHLYLDAPEEIMLLPDQRDFRLTFAALDYEQNEPIQYAWRMENSKDTTWHYTLDGSINFSSLAPGSYRIHLRSTNGDGVWVNNERVVTIHKQPHFYETPWFWIVIGLLTAAVGSVVWRVISVIKRQQRELNEAKNLHLSNKERISLLTSQIRELLPIGENPERLEQEAAEKSEEDHKFVTKIKDYIDDHLSDSDLRIEEIAREMCVSRTVLYYRVKELFDTTPNNLVTNLRIDRAQRMLREEGVLVVDVAFKCGFSDAKYFSRQFKKLVGKTPTEYQEHILKEGKRIADNL